MQKNLTFREQDVLKIEINYCNLPDELSDKKTATFRNDVTRAFLTFCEKILYKSAAKKFLLSEQSDEKIFKTFTAKMDFTAEHGTFSEPANSSSNMKIHLDVDINGEKRHKIYSLTNIIVKKKAGGENP